MVSCRHLQLCVHDSAGFYTRGTQDTYNSDDNVFADSLAGELASVTGNINCGYELKTS
jgi:hypothetical protein